MTRPPFDPDALERHEEADPAAEAMERYARSLTEIPPADLADRIMSAVAAEPTPRRSLGGWFAAVLAGRASGHRWARAGVVAAGLVLVIGTVLAVGELGRIATDHSNVGNTPSPSVMPASPRPTPSPTPEPTATPRPTVSPSEPEASAPEPSEDGTSTATATSAASPTATEHDGEDHGGGTETPQPTETPRATEEGQDG